MEFNKTRAVAPRFEWRDTCGSTNTELRELALRENLPSGTVFATHMQRGGRGRLGREWVTPPGTSLAISVLLGPEHFANTNASGSSGQPASLSLPITWIPLLAGSAVAQTLQPLFPAGMRVGVKWPNDVHVRTEEEAADGSIGGKLCGVLCEMLPDGSIIVGIGINLLVPEWELPTETATSVLVAGGAVGGAEDIFDPLGEDLADRVMSACLQNLLRLVTAAVTDERHTRTIVMRHSLTLHTTVRVHLPDGKLIDGRAVGLDPAGALIVEVPTGGQLVVHAGDVEHLR